MLLNYATNLTAISTFVLLMSLHVGAKSNPEEMEDYFGLDDTVTIATGKATPISKAPAVASVITAKDIANMGAVTLEQILESVPGLHASISSIRYAPTYQIRGIGTDTNPQVLFLVNGVPMTQLYLGERGTLTTFFPIKTIERIEIIRGPGSAMYGADAFAGVINIVTQSSQEETNTETGLQIGSFDTYRSWIKSTGKIDEFNYLVSVEHANTRGDKDRIISFDQQSLFDLGLGTNVSFAPNAANTQVERMDIMFELSKGDSTVRLWHVDQNNIGTGPGIALALDPIGTTDSETFLIDYHYLNQELSKNWELDIRTNFRSIKNATFYILFPSGAVLPIDSNGNVSPVGNLVTFTDGLIGTPSPEEKHYNFSITSYYSGFKNHQLRFAAGSSHAELKAKETKNFGPGVINGSEGTVDGRLTNVTGTPFIFIRNNTRKVHYLSIQDEWSMLTDWKLTTGFRYDKYSDFGSTFNPRLALVWNTNQNITTKLLYGQAFRAPAFAELFAINNPVVLGNSNLKPEKIDTYEISIDYRPAFDFRLGANLFHYEVKDLIEFVPNSASRNATAQNFFRQDGKGIELEFESIITKSLSVEVNYALQDSKNKTQNAEVPNNPEQEFYFKINWSLYHNWLISSQVNHIMNRNRLSGDTRSDISDYTNIDLALRNKSEINGWTFLISISNILDSKNREPSPANLELPTGSPVPNDFLLEGRNYTFEAEYQF